MRIAATLLIAVAASPSPADEEVAEKAEQSDSIEYIDYDWSLNRPDNFPEVQ